MLLLNNSIANSCQEGVFPNILYTKFLYSLGALFYYCCDELEDIKFHEALQLIIEVLKTVYRKNCF